MAQGPAKVTIKLKIAGHVASKGKAGQGLFAGPASKKRQLLEGYPGPDAPVSEILAALRKGEPFSASALLAPWDSALELFAGAGCGTDGAGSVAEVPSTKRVKSEPASGVVPASTAVVSEEQAKRSTLNASSSQKAGHAKGSRAGSEQHAAAAHARTAPVPKSAPEQPQQQEAACAAPACELPGAGSNHSSSHDTNSGLYQQNPSPAEVTATLRDAPASILPDSNHTAAARQLAEPSTSRRAQHGAPRVSMSVQAGQDSILPPAVFKLEGADDTIARRLDSVAPWQMYTIDSPSSIPDSSLSDVAIERLIGEAQSRKRAGDSMRGSGPWTINSLSMYVEASLMFMDACEYRLRLSKTPERLQSTAALYYQTGLLLSRVVANTGGMEAPHLAKAMLRTLCDRLHAVCAMREAAIHATRNIEYANRALQLLEVQRSKSAVGAPSQQQQAGHQRVPGRGQAAPGTAAAAGAAGAKQASGKPPAGGQQPSPDDSSNSCQDHMAVTQAGGLALRGGRGPTAAAGGASAQHAQASSQQQANEMQYLCSKMAHAAKQAAEFSELLKRSASSFRELLERADVQDSQHAKEACMHMALILMDVGMMHRQAITAHSHRVLASLRQLQ